MESDHAMSEWREGAQSALARLLRIGPDAAMNRFPALPLVALAALSGCVGDETVARYGAAGGVWQLSEIDGRPFAARATLSFPEPGRVAGEAPCNLYSGAMTAPYPWFEAGALAVTRRACPEMAAEARFFDALGRVTLAEVQGDVLILSDPAGPEMVFTRVQP